MLRSSTGGGERARKADELVNISHVSEGLQRVSPALSPFYDHSYLCDLLRLVVVSLHVWNITGR